MKTINRIEIIDRSGTSLELLVSDVFLHTDISGTLRIFCKRQLPPEMDDEAGRYADIVRRLDHKG